MAPPGAGAARLGGDARDEGVACCSNRTRPRAGDGGDRGDDGDLGSLSLTDSRCPMDALARATFGLLGDANLATARAKPMRRWLSLSVSVPIWRAARDITRGYLYRLHAPGGSMPRILERHESVCCPCGSSSTVNVSPLTVMTTGRRVRDVVVHFFTSTTLLRSGAICGADILPRCSRAARHRPDAYNGDGG